MAPSDKVIRKRDLPAAPSEIPTTEAVAPVPTPEAPASSSTDGLEDLAGMDPKAFEALMEASTRQVSGQAQGDTVTGTVVRLDADYAYVDLGGKAEAFISLSELKDGEACVGASLSAMVLRVGDDGVLLSRGLGRRAVPELLDAASTTGIPVEGRVESRNSGGYVVNLAGTRAFCPVSQIDRYPGRDLDAFIGQSLQFRVLQIRDREVVISRRALQEKEIEEQRTRIWSEVAAGQSLEGVVTSVRDYGAFVDLGGVEGLIHKSELSWDEVENPQNHVKRWDRVKVWVLEVDQKRKRIALTMRDPDMSPWTLHSREIQVDQVLEGKVVKLAEFGAFVELAPGVTGLARLPNLSWDNIQHPSQAVNVGDVIRVRVLEIDESRQRIDLGVRQATADPSNAMAEKYLPGTEVEAIIQEVSRNGLNVVVDNEIKGWIPSRDVQLPPGVMLQQRYRKGGHLKARIVEFDRKRRQIKLTQNTEAESDERDALRRLEQDRKKAPESLGTLADLLGKVRIDR